MHYHLQPVLWEDNLSAQNHSQKVPNIFQDHVITHLVVWSSQGFDGVIVHWKFYNNKNSKLIVPKDLHLNIINSYMWIWVNHVPKPRHQTVQNSCARKPHVDVKKSCWSVQFVIQTIPSVDGDQSRRPIHWSNLTKPLIRPILNFEFKVTYVISFGIQISCPQSLPNFEHEGQHQQQSIPWLNLAYLLFFFVWSKPLSP